MHVRGRGRLRHFEGVIPPALLPARRIDHGELQGQRKARERGIGGEISQQFIGLGGPVGFNQHDTAGVVRYRLQRIQQLAKGTTAHTLAIQRCHQGLTFREPRRIDLCVLEVVEDNAHAHAAFN